MTAAITDFAQYSDLRMGAKGNDPEVLREVAGQFEALFLQSMLKSMRDASLGDPLFGDNDAHEMYEGMMDQQLAMEMSSGKGIGLAEMLVRQLGGEEAARSSPERSYGLQKYQSGGDSKEFAIHMGKKSAEPRSYEIKRGDGAAKEYAIDRAEKSYPINQSIGNTQSHAWETPEKFVRDIWPHAQRVARQLNVPAEGVMAQAALETGWGKHVMPGQNGNNSFNLFGIKAGSSWSGDKVARQTVEFDGDVARVEVAQFRAYDDVRETFEDYARLLTANSRYSSVPGHGDDVRGFAAALQESGYATDPDYAEKISRVAGSDTMTRVLADLKITGAAPINP
ncbi:MAG: flagellar assembly peptidoglycan hydrolase FlgJ [Woeseiaceae bacterium]|nr:flagellar assembly peptidoglycan hydrolase FlgJ [Woeseiaceae bacterium]